MQFQTKPPQALKKKLEMNKLIVKFKWKSKGPRIHLALEQHRS